MSDEEEQYEEEEEVVEEEEEVEEAEAEEEAQWVFVHLSPPIISHSSFFLYLYFPLNLSYPFLSCFLSLHYPCFF
jgi:hypothetical protein